MRANPPKPRHLIVRLRNWVGDVVLGLPALKVLEEAGYMLTLVARGRWAPDLLKGTPWRVLVQPPGLRARVAQLRGLRRELRGTDPSFDGRINTLLLPQSFSSALEARWAGLQAFGCAHEGRRFLLKKSCPMPTQGHVASQYVQLSRGLLASVSAPQPTTSAAGVPDVNLPIVPSAVSTAQGLLHAHQIGPRYGVVCPFAGGKSANAGLDKSWPAFPEFVRLAAQALRIALVIYPGPGEVALARQTYPDAVCIEDSRLDVYAALLQGAALVVAIDTGPGHMAAAVGAPLLSLIGPTLAEHWRPLGPQVELVTGYPEWPSAQHVLERCQRVLTASELS